MTWYLQHQRAKQIVAEHEREADRIRLARLAMAGPSRRSIHQTGLVRRTVARPLAFVGRSATRLAQALDSDRQTTTGGRTTDSGTLRLDRTQLPPRI